MSRSVLILWLLLCFPLLSMAQNMQVIGKNSMARECYRASTAAALSGSASRLDLQSCDNAIEHGHLRRGDLIATYVNRGVINTALQQYKAAAKDYNQALSMDQNLPEAYVNRGNLWFMANRYQEAIVDYDKALELGFAQPYVALLNRGMVREAIGQLDAARTDYLAALEERAEWPTAMQKLQRVEKKLAQREKSKNQQD